MVLEGTLVLLTLLGCGPPWEMPKVKLPDGPNLKTASPTAAEPYEIVVIGHVSWSPDNSLAHYRLRYQNRLREKKVGKVVLGFFVDVSTGKTLASYRVEKAGFMCPSLAPLWKRSQPKEWGEALVKKIGFVAAKKHRTWHPRAAGTLKLQGVKSRVGWAAAWRLPRWFAWRWQAFFRNVQAGEKLDPWLELRYRPKGKRKWQVLHRHRPYLDYHFSLAHRHIWKQARTRERWTREAKYCEPGSWGDEGECKLVGKKKLGRYHLGKNDEYPFTGQVWIYWNKAGDAVLGFWDDRQAMAIDTDKAFVTYRSHVTVHSLVKRAASTLVPEPPPPMAEPVMKTVMKPAPKPLTMSPAARASMQAMAPKSAAKPKKKGCQCQTGIRPGIGFGLLALLALIAIRRCRTQNV